MANPIVPFVERGLTPDEVELLDRRRRLGHLFLVLGWQFLLVSIFVSLWSGQDLTYSPGWTHPMFYWDCLIFTLSMIFFVNALRLRRGVNEFFSY
jgi:hypothetical protein